jgi:glycosyltransferase involved in cell wall biosynthesis
MKKLLGLPRNLFFIMYAPTAMWRYDVFIFSFGESLLPCNLDMPILHWLGKTVISNIAHGSDARPPYLNGVFQSFSGMPCELSRMAKLTKRKKKKVMFVERFSRLVIGAPFSSSHFCRSNFINWFWLGVPMHSAQLADSGESIRVAQPEDLNRAIRILHSPSKPSAKGSPAIIAAVDRLIEKGHVIEFVLLQGRPYKDVLAEIRRCDFVVDQLYSDTPMAGFATEAAWFGKPAVVGGYDFDSLKRLFSESMWPPSMTCHPNEIEQAIEDLIVNREKRLQLGAEAQRFVRSNWSAAAVAHRYLRLINDDIPEAWWLDPSTVTYLEGMGQPVERTQKIIRQMVAGFGIESLQLSHRPDLERAFLELAGLQGVD